MKRLVFVMLWAIIGLVAYFAYGYLDFKMGLFRDRISVSGTGSMYPTFPQGQGTDSGELSHQSVASISMRRFPGGISLFGQRLFHHKLSRGDIVSFENAKTHDISQAKSGEASGFIKRVIGLPGETIEIRDGFVLVNGQPLEEQYIAGPRSTFGGTFLHDCRPLLIPPNFVFVMGDNRKSSSDSRHDLELVPTFDIDHILPLSEQILYSINWRDASHDFSQSLKPLLDKQVYLKLINEKRRENNLTPLAYQSKLENSATIRADAILQYDDLSFSATKSGVTMSQAMAQVGYSNIVWGEAPTLGYYSAAELIDNYFEFPNTRQFLLNPEFQETGISAKIGQLNGCPVQIVVAHFAGYKPPNYSSEVISSWQKGLESLKNTRSDWEKLKTYPRFYSQHTAEVDELLGLFTTRINRIQAIVTRMSANQWLTKQEEAWAKEDDSLEKRMSELSSRLNSY